MGSFILSGFRGDNPLGYLAALGLCNVLSCEKPEWQPRLDWVFRGSWHAALNLSIAVSAEELVSVAFDLLKKRSACFGEIAELDGNLCMDRESFRRALGHCKTNGALQFLSAAAAELPLRDEKIPVTPLRMVNGAGHQNFLPIVNEVSKAIEPEHLRKTLFENWTFSDEGRNRSLRWDPSDRREYALRWRDPSKDESTVQLGANRLAIEAVPLFQTFPGAKNFETTGFFRSRTEKKRVLLFRWPIWSVSEMDGEKTAGLLMTTIRCLLSVPFLQDPVANRQALRQMGVRIVYECERLQEGYFGNFSPSSAHPI